MITKMSGIQFLYACDWFSGSGSQILPEFESVDLNEIPEASSQTSEALSEQLKVWTKAGILNGNMVFLQNKMLLKA